MVELEHEYLNNGEYLINIPVIFNLSPVENYNDCKKNYSKLVEIEYDNGEAYCGLYVIEDRILVIIDGDSEWGERVELYTVNPYELNAILEHAHKYIDQHPNSGWLEDITWG